MHNLSFATIAKRCSGHGQKATNSADIAAVIDWAFAMDGPELVKIMTDAELI